MSGNLGRYPGGYPSGNPGAGDQAYRWGYPPPAKTQANSSSGPANSQEPLHATIVPANKVPETRKYTAEDWSAQRPEITRLYKDNTLDTVVQVMREQHGLDATPRQYKDRLKKWGLNKHVQSSEMEAVIRKQREREAQGKQSVFHIRGQLVSQEKINRYKREHPEDQLDAHENVDADLDMTEAVTPEAVTCHTPPYTGFSTPQEASSTQQPPPLPPRPSQQLSGYGYSQPLPPHSFNTLSGNAPPPPPQGPVHFGHTAPQSYTFQYSKCTGRRKALLIGINYFGQKGQLRGCINDVRNMTSFLCESYGYLREDMVILTDDQQNPMSQPTKQNMLRAMHWLVKDARPNDSLFFHYSGHGGQTKDLDGDKEDGYDEVIYPVDFRQAGHIVDDEMHKIMVRPLQAGVRLTAIFDSCHSVGALDLPYLYSTQGLMKEPNLAEEAGQGLLSAISNYGRGDLRGVANGVVGFFKKGTAKEEALNRAVSKKVSPADVIMLSSGKNGQTLADLDIAIQATGAMSWAFITAIRKNSQQSYLQLLSSISDELASKYSMKPELSCSHPLNTDLLFAM